MTPTPRNAAGYVGLASQLRQVAEFAARRWRTILSVIVAGSACAWALSTNREPLYSATSNVLIARESVANQIAGLGTAAAQSFQQLLVTQAHIAETPTVLAGALNDIGAPSDNASVERLKSLATVRPEENSDILEFTVANQDPRLAIRLSSALARSYIAYRLRLDTQAISVAIKDLGSALARARNEQGAQSRLASSLASQLEQLQGRAALQSANAQVISEPARARQVSPQPMRDTALGFVLSILLGITIAVGRDVFGTRVRPEEVKQLLGDLPALGYVDVRDPAAVEKHGGPLMLTTMETGAQEQFRLLRANLEFSMSATDSTVVLITSSGPAEGKTMSLANIAVSLALSGKNVVAVDLDLRRPRLHHEFGIPDKPGLTAIIVDHVHPDKVLIDIPLPGDLPQMTARGRLYVLTVGHLPPGPSEFLGVQRVASLVGALRERFDYVLIDTPPFTGLSDVTTISRYADAAIICVRPRVARRASVQTMLETMSRMNIRVLGAVVTDGRGTPHATYYYSHNS